MGEEYATCPECGSDWTSYDSSDETLYCANCNRYFKMRQQTNGDLTFSDIIEPIIGPPLKRFIGLFNPSTWLNRSKKSSEQKQRKNVYEHKEVDEERRMNEDAILSRTIPNDILNLLRSKDLRQRLAEICTDNGVSEEVKIRRIAYETGQVLLGNLRVEQFQEALEERAHLSSHLSSQIAREINESVFEQVGASLANIHSKDYTK